MKRGPNGNFGIRTWKPCKYCNRPIFTNRREKCFECKTENQRGRYHYRKAVLARSS